MARLILLGFLLACTTGFAFSDGDVLSAVAYVSSGVAADTAEHGLALSKPDSFPGEPANVVAVRVFQPRVFGGVMIRGHCGGFLLARSVPIIARLALREEPASSSIHTDDFQDDVGAPWSHGEAEGVLRSIDNLFAIGHPLSLFRDDLAELDRWHEARVKALDAIHSNVFKLLQESRNADETEEGPAVSVGPRIGESQRELGQDFVEPSVEVDNAANPVPMGETTWDIEWTPVNFAGVALLVLAFGLLVVMLLMSLSTIIYGCSEEEPESFVETETSMQTPLLKSGLPAPDDGSTSQGLSVTNPVYKYQPPMEKM